MTVTQTSTRVVDLVAIDVDGTLLRTNRRVARRTSRAIANALNQGVHVVLATARPPRSVKQLYEFFGLKTLQINYNGALVFDPVRGEHIIHQPLDAVLAAEMARFARELVPEVVIDVEVLDQWFTDRVDENFMTETARVFSPNQIAPLQTFLNGRDPVTKLMLMCEPRRLPMLANAVRDRFGQQAAMMISDSYMIQIADRQVDKAHALAWIASFYGIDRYRVMAIGDELNDLGMIRWAGIGAAVENAPTAVREAGDVILPSNDQDGVAFAIEVYALDHWAEPQADVQA